MAVGDRRRARPDRLRISAWRGDHATAVVTPRPELAAPGAGTVRQCVDSLVERGVREIMTSALGQPEQAGFLAAGFELRERLHLLSHDLDALPEVRATVRLRRARHTDRPAVLAIDHRAFDTFWRLDDLGLEEALDATPVSRFRLAVDDVPAGYAVFGRAADRGYVQRLAVDPLQHGRGIGTSLLADGLRWLRRHAVKRAVVNTQEGNDAALRLYESVGFRREPEGLAVLAYQVGERER